MKLVPVPVKRSYRGTTEELFQHLGFPLQALFEYVRKPPCSARLCADTAVVSHPFPFKWGCDEALLVLSGVTKFFLMPFNEVFMFYGTQRTFSPHVYVDSRGAASRPGSPQSVAAVDRGIQGSRFLFLGETPGDCFSTCLLWRLSLMRTIRL